MQAAVILDKDRLIKGDYRTAALFVTATVPWVSARLPVR
jgi:hypothetical protein